MEISVNADVSEEITRGTSFKSTNIYLQILITCINKKKVVAFPWVVTSTWPGGFID